MLQADLRVAIAIDPDSRWYSPQKTNMTMEKQPCEDVSPIKNGEFPI